MQLGNLVAEMFAPAKMAFAAYVILVALGRIEASRFWVAVVLFLLVEIGHNDWLRILLNKWAEGSVAAKRAAEVGRLK